MPSASKAPVTAPVLWPATPDQYQAIEALPAPPAGFLRQWRVFTCSCIETRLVAAKSSELELLELDCPACVRRAKRASQAREYYQRRKQRRQTATPPQRCSSYNQFLHSMQALPWQGPTVWVTPAMQAATQRFLKQQKNAA